MKKTLDALMIVVLVILATLYAPVFFMKMPMFLIAVLLGLVLLATLANRLLLTLWE